MAQRQHDINERNRITDIVCSFFKWYESFKESEKQYKYMQEKFNAEMDAHFNTLSGARKNDTFEDSNGDLLVVTKVSPTKIEWIPEKLKARVTKPVWKKLVKKRYEIVDMAGLVRYLKSCGVNPVIFKGFIEVTETVDEKQIERLGDLGELTPHNIAGCYVVKSSKPYYKLKRKSVEKTEQ